MKKHILILAVIFSASLFSSSAWAQSLTDRVEHYSQHFLGTLYELGPLGEGENGLIDTDPLLRYDKFDCTTFIETVLALSLVDAGPDYTNEKVTQMMNILRYSDGSPSYVTRNHFTSADWNPHISVLQLAQDVSASLFPENSSYRNLVVQKTKWFPKQDKENKLDLSNVQDKVVSMPYLRKADILANPEILNRIPSPSIVNIVRENWIAGGKHISFYTGTDMAISHQGLAVMVDGVMMFRNASGRKSNMKVVDEPLIDYMRRYADEESHVGLNILQIRQ